MAYDWHETFKRWAAPPSQTEEQKGKRAADMIRDALRNSSALNNADFSVYATGSYRNNTNVRLDSDIDVGVVLTNCFFHNLPEIGLTPAHLGLGSAAYGYHEFRSDVENALQAKFGSGMSTGDKAFNIHANTYRLDADVAVFCQYRKYSGQRNPDGTLHYLEGAELRPNGNRNKRIVNWHQQHYENGVAKNNSTGRRFKRVTRILKRLRNDMKQEGTSGQQQAAQLMSSFLIESLAFNVPDDRYYKVEGGYYEDIREAIAYLWNATRQNGTGTYMNFFEVNNIKPLFSEGQPWAVSEVHDFLLNAWHYVGFTNG